LGKYDRSQSIAQKSSETGGGVKPKGNGKRKKKGLLQGPIKNSCSNNNTGPKEGRSYGGENRVRRRPLHLSKK